MKTYMLGVARQGDCLQCGEPVATHFDDRNAKHDCATVRQLREDERAHEPKETAMTDQQAKFIRFVIHGNGALIFFPSRREAIAKVEACQKDYPDRTFYVAERDLAPRSGIVVIRTIWPLESRWELEK